MTIKSIKTKGIALVLAAGIMMGAGAPALAGRARAAETQTVTEVTPVDGVQAQQNASNDNGGYVESTNKKDFESRVSGGNDKDNCGNKNVLTADEMNKLFAHVKKVVAEKRKTNPNYTAWQYFYEIGFRALAPYGDQRYNGI